jgi:N-acetylglutamate synthase-like GNAT family acetyltransferase
MYTIRPATEQDQAAIRSLIRKVGINPLGIKWQRFLIAVNEADALIGCGQVKTHRDGSLELASIAVTEAWRKQGIGTAIIRDLKAANGHPLWLTCRFELTSFYEASGFVEFRDIDRMPPHFRRVKRFAKLYQTLTQQKIRLAVMVCDAPSQMADATWPDVAEGLKTWPRGQEDQHGIHHTQRI